MHVILTNTQMYNKYDLEIVTD